MPTQAWAWHPANTAYGGFCPKKSPSKGCILRGKGAKYGKRAPYPLTSPANAKTLRPSIRFSSQGYWERTLASFTSIGLKIVCYHWS